MREEERGAPEEDALHVGEHLAERGGDAERGGVPLGEREREEAVLADLEQGLVDGRRILAERT